MTDQLSANDWLDQGLKTLARRGFTALKAEPLAKAMGVSRGSFYWHFTDIGALKTALADYKVPKHIEIQTNLPREDSGKIFKRRLRDPYWERAGRRI